MMKKLLSIFVCLSLICTLGVYAFADGEGFIIDEQQYLYDEASLELLAQEVYDKYGIAVVYFSAAGSQGLTGAELSQNLYNQYVGLPDGILMLDCREYSTYYMHYAGSAQEIFAQGDGNAMMSAYDQCATYDEAVRAYLNAADSILSQRLGESRNLVLLDDLSENTVSPVITAQPEDSQPLLSLEGDNQEVAPQPVQTAVPAIPENRQLPLVVDTAGVIDPARVAALQDYAAQLSEKYRSETAAVFVASTGGQSIQAFADDFYDYNGYGYGDSDSGIMLCVAVADRKFAVTTYGPAAYTFSDYGQAYMDEAYLPYLRNGDWGGAAEAYLKACEQLMEYERVNGRPYDIDSEEPESLLGGQILLSLIVGFVLAFIPIGSMKRKMLNVQKQSDAAEYVQRGSFQLNRSFDRYITSHISRVPRPKPEENNRGSGGGGGTTFHVSSSGRTHGGHSGSF